MISDCMTIPEAAKVAQAIHALKTEAPATTAVLAAVSALESLMPLPGTPNSRIAWDVAHHRMGANR